MWEDSHTLPIEPDVGFAYLDEKENLIMCIQRV